MTALFQLKYELYGNTFWLNERTKYYFKQNSNITDRDGEILYSYLAQQLDLEVVKVRPAIDVNVESRNKIGVEGIIVEHFAHELPNTDFVFAYDLKYVDCEHSVENNLKGLKKYQNALLASGAKKVVLDKNIKLNLQKMFIMDFLTMQRDRHSANVVYFCTKQPDGTIFVRLGKIFDNSMVFDFCSPVLKRLAKYSMSKKAWGNYVDACYRPRFFLKQQDIRLYEDREKGENITKYHAKQIAALVQKDERIRDFYYKALNLSFDQVYSKIKKDMPQYKFDFSKIKLARIIWNHRVQVLQKQVDLEQKRALAKHVFVQKTKIKTTQEQQIEF